MKNYFLVPIIAVSLCACSSAEKRKDIAPAAPAYEKAPSAPKIEEIVDMRALQTILKLDTPRDVLGYREKKFNTCKVGAGYSDSQNCRNLVLVVVHFRIQCRDSEGTVSEVVTKANLQPVSNRTIKWKLNRAEDEILSDSDGNGQIVMVSPESQRGQRMRLTSGNDFLAIRAGEARSLIAPKDWCE